MGRAAITRKKSGARFPVEKCAAFWNCERKLFQRRTTMNFKTRKRLLKLLCCFIPSHKIRKRVHGSFDRYFYFKAKKSALLAPQIRTIVIGSSHARVGF